jgi:type II secretory pathway component PulF
MAVVEPVHSKRTSPLGGPPRWARALVYSLTWLPALVLVVGFVPRFDPVFRKLTAMGELPQLTGWLLAFVQLDAASFHLPVVLVAIALLAIDEAAVRLLRRRARGNLWSWLWVGAAGLAGLVAQFVIVVGLLDPAFKMGSTVR